MKLQVVFRLFLPRAILLLLVLIVGSGAAMAQGEAPMLREMVEAGKLPALKERLPLEPLVLKPVEGDQIGRYGGTIRLADQRSHRSVSASGIKSWARLITLAPDMETIIPNVAKAFEFSADWTSATFTLREGMKWSDGAPFTADDVMFWYEDMFLNKELLPTIQTQWRPGGEPVKVEKLDDYTVKFTFAQTYPTMPYAFLRGPQFHYPFWPKHYLSQFHPNHTPRAKVEAMAKEAGYDNWVSDFAPLHNYRFNQTTNDPVLREIFRDIRFRRAMSLAINRDEINELLLFGTGTPMQATVNNPNSRFWDDKNAFAYVEYKPDEANRLLDEMGLKWDENRKWRMRPDGKRLSFVNVWDEGRTYLTSATELVTEYWAAVGVEMLQRPMDVATYPNVIQNNDYDVLTFPASGVEATLRTGPFTFVPCCHWLNGWGQLWYNWHESGGEKGEEPPAEVKVLYDHVETLFSNPDDAARDAAMHAIFKSHAENLWTIGTVGLFPQLAAANKNIANVPDIGLTAQWMSRHDSVALPETWFFKEGN